MRCTLTEPRRRLIDWMRRIGFGRIEQLVVRNREPVLHPPPRHCREHKFGGDNGPPRDGNSGDWLHKPQVVEFLRLLDQVGDGIIAVIEIKHGVVFRAFLADTEV